MQHKTWNNILKEKYQNFYMHILFMGIFNSYFTKFVACFWDIEIKIKF